MLWKLHLKFPVLLDNKCRPQGSYSKSCTTYATRIMNAGPAGTGWLVGHIPTGCVWGDPPWEHIPNMEKSSGRSPPESSCFQTTGFHRCLWVLSSIIVSMRFTTPALCPLYYPAVASPQGSYILVKKKDFLFFFNVKLAIVIFLSTKIPLSCMNHGF